MNTLNPYYNESFRFELAQSALPKTALWVTVMDYDRVGSNDPIGRVILGAGGAGPTNRHWMDMIAAPRRSIAQWHPLAPVEEKKWRHFYPIETLLHFNNHCVALFSFSSISLHVSTLDVYNVRDRNGMIKPVWIDYEAIVMYRHILSFKSVIEVSQLK